MSSKHTLFRIFYRLGFTPWDGHPIAQNLQDLVEELPAAKPSNSVAAPETHRSTWRSTAGKSPAVDYVPQALEKARAKADRDQRARRLRPRRRHRLSQAGIGADFGLIVDNGCLHNMSDGDRDAYVREVSAMAAPDARLLIVAFAPGGSFGVRGVQPAEMERRFSLHLDDAVHRKRAGDWTQEQTPARYYLYERKNP